MNGRIKSKACLIVLIFLLGMACTSAAGRTIYVDADASGANDGSSWDDAFNYLQDALADANSALKPVEIRVAEGIYTPDSNSANPNGSGDREATFQLINDVIIKGGYAGFGSPDPDARDVDQYQTILSGDLNGNDIEVADPCDLLTEPTRAENSYNVVTGSGTDANAVLDGFTITGGNANSPIEWPYVHVGGAGMYNESGSPIVADCVFRANSAAWSGGGTYNDGYGGVCSPIFTNCAFTGNWGDSGGGTYNYGYGGVCSPIFTNCAFAGNCADGGGGMCNANAEPILDDCVFMGNSAGWSGGGIGNGGGGPILTNCAFVENSAGRSGGAMYNDSSSTVLTNCAFADNSAAYRGGAMFNEECSPTLANCTLSGNSAGEWRGGGGMYNYKAEPTLSNCILTGNVNAAIVDGTYASNMIFTITNCTFTGNDCAVDPGASAIVTITNSILWNGGDENEIGFHDPWLVNITYSDVQGGWWGNIDADPCFADPGYWDPNCTPEDANDDFWIDGDYHLFPDSPCINAGDPNYVAEPNETDLDGRPRVIGGRIDMGAYEYSPPIQAELRIVPRTISLASSGKWIGAFLRLPEEYNVANIDPNSIFLENEIEPERFWLSEDNQIALIKFDREEVQNILSVGQVELTITGWFVDGTAFEGTDVTRVLNKESVKSSKKKK